MSKPNPATRSKRRQQRLEAGLCSNCPRLHASDKTLCLTCLEKMRSRTKVWLNKRKQAGICMRCNDSVEPRRTMCRPCLDLWRQERKERIAVGCCPYCRKPNKSSKAICPNCSKKRKEQSNQKRAAGVCVSTGCYNLAVVNRVNCQTCINRRSEKLRQLKQIVLDHYGQRCNCSCKCQVTNFRHLTIDHRNNDGAAQRREEGTHGGHANYRKIIKASFPTDLQVLCWNCNCAKHYYGGCQ